MASRSMVVDGEDSSEEDIDTIKHGSSGASPTNSSRTALEYKAANFMPEPQNPIVGSLQERLLPSAQQQLDLLAQLSHEHEQLLRLVNRERQTVDGLCQDMQDAQEVLQKVPSYEVKLKTMMQQMQRIWDTIQEVSYQSTQAEKQLRLESEKRAQRRQFQQDFDAAHAVAEPVPVSSSKRSSPKSRHSKDNSSSQQNHESQAPTEPETVDDEEVRDGE